MSLLKDVTTDGLRLARSERACARDHSASGVGLKERVRQLAGHFEIGSNSTRITSARPLPIYDGVSSTRQTDAQVFKKYSQMKLQMKREALDNQTQPQSE